MGACGVNLLCRNFAVTIHVFISMVFCVLSVKHAQVFFINSASKYAYIMFILESV